MKVGVDVSQASTWRGIVWLIVSAGISAMDQQQLHWFLPLALVIVGALGMFVKDPEHPIVTQPQADDESLDNLIKRGRQR